MKAHAIKPDFIIPERLTNIPPRKRLVPRSIIILLQPLMYESALLLAQESCSERVVDDEEVSSRCHENSEYAFLRHPAP